MTFDDMPPWKRKINVNELAELIGTEWLVDRVSIEKITIAKPPGNLRTQDITIGPGGILTIHFEVPDPPKD